jgi:hemolysin III
MASTLPVAPSEGPHYPRPIERSADRWVHIIGLAGGGIGGLVLLGMSLGVGRLGQAAAVGVYAFCLVLMFLASTAYNMAGAKRRPLLRRLDHAAIFLMIAGSYTPFTTQRLTGTWAWGMTLAVWVVALAAAAGKLFAPGLGRKVWVAVYLLLGWIVVVAIKPMLAGVSAVAMILLLIGGLVYSLGVIVYLKHDLPFRRAIWHGFVTAAAATHFVAILTGVVLPARA